ncbi:tail fiber domain-containing protein [Enterococcus faecalis]|uniref:tail fiber domain-containing protein n=1 Tax=Enterococcus faecalis TaxID=1351 RepID=UPI00177DC71F|nr:tail fiber domain-containing protein [Enterococcus faecalis]MBD9846479.1 tail fiber domain-containing protein [Enterococcus faecalis]
MLNVSKDFHLAFADSEREIFINIFIKDKLYQKENIKNFEYSTGAFGGEAFQIGSTQSATIKITFTEIIEGLKELDEVKVELGIKIRGTGSPTNVKDVSRVGYARVGKAHLITYVPDKYEFVPLGIFYISNRVDPNRNENTTTIEARDGFLFLEGTYDSQLAYPTKVSDVALEIANLSGSIIDEESFSHLSKYVINKPEGYTYRQAIGLIGQFEAGFVCFDRYGNLAIRKLADPKFSITPDLYFLNGLTKNELLYQPKGISCKVIKKKDESSNETTTLTAGLTSGPQINIENNIMTQSLLQMIYEKIKDLNFYPINLEWRGNPALEVGDWVTLIDRKGNKFKSPILGYTISFDGGIKSVISADTKSASANVVAYKGPLQQKLEEIDYRIDAAGKNNVYDGPEEPKYPKEGDLWFKPNGPDTEIWIYRDGKWVMQTSTALDEDIKEKIENSTPSDEIVKTINLSQEMDGKEWLKITGAKIWLTNQTKIDDAIITHSMIGSVDAGTIKVGTLDAGKIRVVNLDANSISSGTLRSINIAGVTIIGSTVTSENGTNKITMGSGTIKNFLDDKLFSEMAGGAFRLYKSNGVNTLGGLYRTREKSTGREYLNISAYPETDLWLGRYDSSLNAHVGSIRINGNTGQVSLYNTIFGEDINGNNKAIKNIWITGLKVPNDSPINFYSSLNMNGYSILNQSDIRLKENIVNTQIDGIEETRKLNFVEFQRKQNYKSTNPVEQPSKKKELGLIAQFTPFLSVQDESNHYLNLDVNKQIMLNSLTNKQIIEYLDSQEERIKKIEHILGER